MNANKEIIDKNIFDLDGKIAIVTGAYGYLGAGICKALASFNAKVMLIGRNEDKMKDFFQKNKTIFNKNCEYFINDVTDEVAFEHIVKKIIKKHHTIDILINNAYGKQNETFSKLTKERWNTALEITLTHYLTCIQTVSPFMLKAKKGSIINIASIYSFLGTDQRIFAPLGKKSPVHYSVCKGGILQLTRYLAALCGEYNIRVNSVSPGHFPPKRGPERPDYINELVTRTPLKRIGKPDDIAGTIILLCSDASSYITGQNIVVDGGWSVW